jgi:protein-S-isoprenylcysteine O-methyltransferase Ste14
MLAKMLLRTALWLAAMAVLLFGPAGTLDWPAAGLFMAIGAASGLGFGLWLARSDPELLEARLGPLFQRGQKATDKALIAALLVAMCGWFIVMALDAGSYGYSVVPLPLRATGVLAIAACMYVVFLTMRENTFAAPVVRVQTERGHKVIDTGPYAVVRHPMYAGAVLYFIGVPLLLGSWSGLALAPLLAALFALRIVLEERTLRTGLPGYADYAARVRWRLLPGVW